MTATVDAGTPSLLAAQQLRKNLVDWAWEVNKNPSMHTAYRFGIAEAEYFSFLIHNNITEAEVVFASDPTTLATEETEIEKASLWLESNM